MVKRSCAPALLLCTLLSACGSEGAIEISLAEAAFDALPGVELEGYRVELLDDAREIVATHETTTDLLPADLATLAAGSTHRLRVLGLVDSQVLKLGLSQELSFRSGETQRVAIPFSSGAALVALPASRVVRGEAQADGSVGEWIGAPSVELNEDRLLAGPGGGKGDFWATLHLTWDASWVHLALEVRDNCPALVIGEKAGNCVNADEIDRLYFGMDGQVSDGTGFEANDFWIEVSAEGAIPREGTLAEGDIRLAMGRLPAGKGWLFEASVRLTALGLSSPLGPTDQIGLGLLVVDADPTENMISTYGLSKTPLGANSTTIAPSNMLRVGFPQLD